MSSLSDGVSNGIYNREGWVEKGRSKVFALSSDSIKYHGRFLALSRTHILVYSSEPTNAKKNRNFPRKSIALWEIVEKSTVSDSIYFEIATNQRTFKFRTKSREETTGWVGAIFEARKKVFLEGHESISKGISEKFFNENPEENFVDVLSPSSTPMKVNDEEHGEDATVDTQISSHASTPEKEGELPEDTLVFLTPKKCRSKIDHEMFCSEHENSDDVLSSSAQEITPSVLNGQLTFKNIELAASGLSFKNETEPDAIEAIDQNESPHQPLSEDSPPTPYMAVDGSTEQVAISPASENTSPSPLAAKENGEEEEIDEGMNEQSSSGDSTASPEQLPLQEQDPTPLDNNKIRSSDQSYMPSPTIHKGIVRSMRSFYERMSQFDL